MLQLTIRDQGAAPLPRWRRAEPPRMPPVASCSLILILSLMSWWVVSLIVRQCIAMLWGAG